MIKKQLAIIIPIILFIAIGLRLMGQIKESEKQELTTEKELTTEYVFYTDDLKHVEMTNRERQKHGGESSFLKTKMFDDYEETLTFPLIQKKGSLLGIEPTNIHNVIPKSDFSIKTSKLKTFYKLKRVTEKSNLSKCNKVVCMNLFQRSDMGEIRNRNLYLKPADIGHEEEFIYSFPYTIRTKKYGTIPYKCFVTKGNEKLDKIFENYMKLRKRK